MRILFTVIPEKGHLNPYIPVAQALQERGHSVAFHSVADIRPQLREAGLANFLGTPEKPEPPAASRGRYFAERVRDREWLRGWIKMLLIDSVPQAIEPFRKLVAEFDPAVLVTDPMLYQSVIVAEQKGVKWAAISNSLNPVLIPAIESELLRTVAWLAPDRARLFAGHGVGHIEFRGCDALSPYLTGCFTTREFVGYDLPAIEMLGPSRLRGRRGDETIFPWERLDPRRRKVFVSFGSQIYFQPQRFNRIIDAFRDDPDIQVILSVSELLETTELAKVPDSMIAVRYAPQIELLPKIDLFVTHGGANSVMESIAAGVPLLVAPICNDQFHQAWFVENAGVGRAIDLDNLASGEIRDLVRGALDDQNLRQNMRRVQSSYKSDGAMRAADLIEAMS